MSGNQPIIGITVGLGDEWSRGGSSLTSYASAVESAGAKTVILGHGRHGRFDECDGILVSGGNDLHPKYTDPLSGDESLSHEAIMEKYKIKTERMRDEVELRMIGQALKRGMPYLGICRGFQVLNVAVGRLLIGDILTWNPKALRHFSQEGVSASHEVSIEPQSILGKAYGSSKITTNSRHHQGITPEFVSDRFRISAMAPDGIVEAVELKDAPFVVGVQWHPEKKTDEYINSISGPLFQAFVDACADWRKSK